jgi:hypothetical protein
MAGYNAIMKLRKLEEAVDNLGFKFASPRHGGYNQDYDNVALVPKDEHALPIYSRDAELYVGTLENLQHWLAGVEWARSYDRAISLTSAEKREKKENDYRHQYLLKKLAKDHVKQQ